MQEIFQNEEYIICELQLLTGVVSNDLEYLVYLLLKDGVYFEKESKKVSAIKEECSNTNFNVEDLDSWFKSIKE